MNFKLLCSDLDGTLLTTKNDVSDFTVEEIQRIKNKIRVILVSARMPSAMKYLQERLGIEDQPIICYNGALVLDKKKEIFSTTISLETVKKIYLTCKSYQTDVGLYVNDQWLVSNSSERVDKEIKNTRTNPSFMPSSMIIHYLEKHNLGAHKLMLMGTEETADRLMPVLEEKYRLLTNLYRSNDTLIEVAPKIVSKLSAIKLILKPKETLKDVIAFGDNYNDIEMLEKVGYGVAVGNAREEVKIISDTVTAENTQDGVAHYIKENLRN